MTIKNTTYVAKPQLNADCPCEGCEAYDTSTGRVQSPLCGKLPDCRGIIWVKKEAEDPVAQKVKASVKVVQSTNAGSNCNITVTGSTWAITITVNNGTIEKVEW